GELLLRVPGPGRLDDLEWHFREGLRPPTGATAAYRLVRPAPATTLARGAFGELFAYRLNGPVPMELETTLRVTEALRAAVMSRAGELLGEVPAVLSGHGPDSRPLDDVHAAYLPLPFVSPTQPHADGHLLGVGVALPGSLPVPDRRRAARVLAGMDHLNLRGLGRYALDRVEPGDAVPRALRAEEWSGPTDCWASVTPVVFDRFPKPNGRDVGAIVSRACLRAGLPSPVEVAVGRYSPLFGVSPSYKFPTHRGGAERARRLYA